MTETSGRRCMTIDRGEGNFCHGQLRINMSVLQSRSYGSAPSSQDKNHSEICDPSVNKYW
ncbi:MAG: hypothetical protein K2J65_01665 [Duncaniella sp.]|nr:hypothetical protein [Duncaniella sp.]